MINFESTCEDIYNGFERNGKLTVTTKRNSSDIALITNTNKKVKGNVDTIGLTENIVKRLQWVVCGPEVSRVVEEFNLICISKYTSRLYVKHLSVPNLTIYHIPSR